MTTVPRLLLFSDLLGRPLSHAPPLLSSPPPLFLPSGQSLKYSNAIHSPSTLLNPAGQHLVLTCTRLSHFFSYQLYTGPLYKYMYMYCVYIYICIYLYSMYVPLWWCRSGWVYMYVCMARVWMEYPNRKDERKGRNSYPDHCGQQSGGGMGGHSIGMVASIPCICTAHMS